MDCRFYGLVIVSGKWRVHYPNLCLIADLKDREEQNGKTVGFFTLDLEQGKLIHVGRILEEVYRVAAGFDEP